MPKLSPPTLSKIAVRVSLVAACVMSLGALHTPPGTAQLPDLLVELNESGELGESRQRNLTENPLPASDLARITALQTAGQSTSIAEWLGPMAPVAISPFFGIACLCALSQFGGDLIPGNTFLSENAVLNDPMVLWIFAALTIMTSLPRLTKVSKPFAQAIDQLETYAAIITIVIIRWSMPGEEVTPEIAMAAVPVVQMGVFSFTADALLSVAAIVNILVINSIKFFFEVMVWLTPFPFVDALLEAANKSLCAALIAIYAYSPLVATILNLILFVACVIAMRWTQRRVTWLRSILTDPIRAKLQPSFAEPTGPGMTVFAKSAFGPFPAKSKLALTKSDTGWTLLHRRLFFGDETMELKRDDCCIVLKPGIITNRLEVTGVPAADLLFTQRHAGHFDALAQRFAIQQPPSGNLDPDPALA